MQIIFYRFSSALITKKNAYISCYLKEKVTLVSLLALHSPPVATCNSHDADIKQSNSK